MTYVDYYKILGIAKTATPVDVKNAYRKLARKYHPDLNPNDKDAHKNFQQINEANEVLSDVEKRKKYDQYGSDWKHSEEFEKAKQQQQSSQSQHSRSYGGQSGGDFSDFFESMFGGRDAGGSRSRQAKYRGQDFTAELHLELIDAYTTHKQTITVNDKKIRITIPAGIENGQVIKIVGHGGLGTNSGPNGDLIITFIVSNNEKFKRLGNNLYMTIQIDLYTAILGGDITIETLSGKVKLKVKPGTQNGDKIKLAGKGFPVYKNEDSFGDLVVTFTVAIPKDINEKQRTLFSELSKMHVQ